MSGDLYSRSLISHTYAATDGGMGLDFKTKSKWLEKQTTEQAGEYYIVFKEIREARNAISITSLLVVDVKQTNGIHRTKSKYLVR